MSLNPRLSRTWYLSLWKAAEPIPEPAARFRAELTPPPTPDPFEEVRRVAEQEPRFRALLEVTTGPAWRDLAKAVPELASPHAYLSEMENELLKLVYLEGMSFITVVQKHKLGFNN